MGKKEVSAKGRGWSNFVPIFSRGSCAEERGVRCASLTRGRGKKGLDGYTLPLESFGR